MLEFEQQVSAYQVAEIARQTLEHHFPIYSAKDRVWCRSAPTAWELNYQVRSSTCEVDLDSQLQLFLYPSEGMVWIAHLFITQEQRRRGMGRALVRVTEAIAQRCYCRLLRVHPMYEAQAFWECLGYRLAMGSARILEKELSSPLMLDAGPPESKPSY